MSNEIARLTARNRTITVMIVLPVSISIFGLVFGSFCYRSKCTPKLQRNHAFFITWPEVVPYSPNPSNSRPRAVSSHRPSASISTTVAPSSSWSPTVNTFSPAGWDTMAQTPLSSSTVPFKTYPKASTGGLCGGGGAGGAGGSGGCGSGTTISPKTAGQRCDSSDLGGCGSTAGRDGFEFETFAATGSDCSTCCTSKPAMPIPARAKSDAKKAKYRINLAPRAGVSAAVCGRLPHFMLPDGKIIMN